MKKILKRADWWADPILIKHLEKLFNERNKNNTHINKIIKKKE